MNMQGDQLPSLALYKLNCHSSSGCWLGYLESKTSIKLVQFSPQNHLIRSLEVEFVEEPVMFVKIHQQKQSIIHVLIGFITKVVQYMLKDNQKHTISSMQLSLDRNIVDFMHGFIAADIQLSVGGFVAVTRNAHVYLLPFQPSNEPPADKQLKIGQVDNVVSLCAKQYLYLGNESGNIYQVSLQDRKVMNNFNSKSKLPLLHIGHLNDHIITCTCQGQLYILTNDLKSFQMVSIHTALISRLLTNHHCIYTFGEDGILNSLQYNNHQLTLKSTINHQRLPALLFNINGKTKYTLYNELQIRNI